MDAFDAVLVLRAAQDGQSRERDLPQDGANVTATHPLHSLSTSRTRHSADAAVTGSERGSVARPTKATSHRSEYGRLGDATWNHPPSH